MLRQTEEANLIVASSYNAVVKWVFEYQPKYFIGSQLYEIKYGGLTTVAMWGDAT